MNGSESLLLIIIGLIGIASKKYIAEDSVTISRHYFLTALIRYITIYGWIAFSAGNITFFIWLFKTYF